MIAEYPHQLNIRITESQKQKAMEQAQEKGLSISEWIRQLIENQIKSKDKLDE